ncbi:MAG TPA: hypothetical protein VG939_09500 [Caulobacteraceae bacterium]|nr:hypothetical protein [Caulobacteraceae bacterium]
MKTRAARLLATIAAGVLVSITLASAQSHPGGGVVLPKEVVAAASGFQTYMQRAGDVKADFHSPDAVHERLRIGASYEQNQFEEGMIAYGAVVALQDARFLNAVDGADRSPEGRRALADKLIANPAEAVRFDGADEAAHLVASALSRQAGPVISAGKAVKQAAYDIQHDAWSKGRIGNLPARVREVKSLSAARFVASDADNARLMRAMLTLPEPGVSPSRVSPVIARSLALAAVAKLGYATDADLPGLGPLLTEYYSADCLKMAKLNLYQCMAVAAPHYENVFCLGEHALSDTGQCVAEAVTASPDRFAPPYRPPVAAPVVPVKTHAKPVRRHGAHRRRS